MNPLTNSTIVVEKSDGTTAGPYRVALSGNMFTCTDPKMDVEVGDKILRELPNGRQEVRLVASARYNEGPGGRLSHWRIALRELGETLEANSHIKNTTINIHGSTGIQVGDHNLMTFQIAMNDMISKIDSPSASEDAKAEAKSRLQAFLQHPLVASIAGGIASTVIR